MTMQLAMILTAVGIPTLIFIVLCWRGQEPEWQARQRKQERCPHSDRTPPVKTQRRDEGVRVIYDWMEKCRACGYTNNTRMEVEYRPGGEEAMDQAWSILTELSPRFRQSGSGCLVHFPPTVAQAYLQGGRALAMRKARALLSADPLENQMAFEHLDSTRIHEQQCGVAPSSRTATSPSSIDLPLFVATGVPVRRRDDR